MVWMRRVDAAGAAVGTAGAEVDAAAIPAGIRAAAVPVTAVTAKWRKRRETGLISRP
jgi:hypothetical protein